MNLRKLAIVVIPLCALAAALTLPDFRSGDGISGKASGGVWKLRQLFLAMFEMTTDATVENDPRKGFPGDLGSGPEPVKSAKDYLRRLVQFGYLQPSDVQKLTAAEGVPGWSPGENSSGPLPFKFYRVTAKDGADAIAFASSNFTYGKDLDPNLHPYGKDVFLIIHKGGDGAIVKARQARSLAVIGLLPGRKDLTDRPFETADDVLASD